MNEDLIIDCRTVKSRDGFWAAYVAVIPQDSARDFGRNLDALWDALDGGGPGWPGERTVRLQHFAALRRIDRQLASGLEAIAAELAGSSLAPALVIED